MFVEQVVREGQGEENKRKREIKIFVRSYEVDLIIIFVRVEEIRYKSSRYEDFCASYQIEVIGWRSIVRTLEGI